MIHVILGILGCFMGVFGILSNLYILVILLWNKKGSGVTFFQFVTKPSNLEYDHVKVLRLSLRLTLPSARLTLPKTRTSSEWILLHLSWCGFVGSLFHLCFLSPSILGKRFVFISPLAPFCGICGSGLLILQLATVWSVCALSADRAIAIVYPLRYSQIATSRRIAVYFLIVWFLSGVVMMTSLFLSSFQELDSAFYLRRTGGKEELKDLVPLPKSIQGENESAHTASGYDIQRFGDGVSGIRMGIETNNSSSNSTSWEAVVNDLKTNSANAQEEADQDDFSSSSSSMLLPPTVMNYNDRDAREEAEREGSSDYRMDDRDGTNGSDGEVTRSGTFISEDSENPEFRGPLIREGRSDLSYEFRPTLGICLPKVYDFSWSSVVWTSEYLVFLLIAPMCVLLVCDLAVLSIARRQSHRILLAMTMVTITAQATVTRSKGMAPAPPTGLWVNNVPARSRACRAVAEDVTTLVLLHCPIILILIAEIFSRNHVAPEYLMMIGSLSLFATPSCNALLYGIRARPLRTAYKSYLRIRLTNTTLENEIQNRLSPVDGSPRPSSRAKSFRSSTPSPNSSPSQTPPRRLSSNDLRPPPNQLILTSSPSQDNMGRKRPDRSYYDDDTGSNSMTRKVRSFLHIPSFPSQLDMQEFWSGLRRPNRSPTIVITHEFSMKKHFSKPIINPGADVEQRL